VINGTRNLTSK